MEGKIPMAARRHVSNKLRSGYLKASKADRGRILDEVMSATGIGRSSVRRALTGPVLPDQAEQIDRRKLRPKQYGDDSRVLLEHAWALMGCPCGKYLTVMLTLWLPLLVAAKQGKRTHAEGLRLQRDFLARAGVDVETISFGGGAGGDRADYVTPRATVQLLKAMSKRSDFDVYRGALPVLGVDGTLASAVVADSPAKGHAQAKTGTLVWTNVLLSKSLLQSKALAGYVDASEGRTIIFACFVNLVPLQQSGDRDRIGRVLGSIAEKLHAAP